MLSRHDSATTLLNVVEDALLELSLDFEQTDAYKKYQPQYDETIANALRCLSLLKDKP